MLSNETARSLLVSGHIKGNEAKLPAFKGDLIMEYYTSTTLSPASSVGFLNENDKLLYKITSEEKGLGVDVSGISSFSNENEILYPPGTLFIRKVESDIKHPEHYSGITNVNKKVSSIAVSGVSEKSQLYSSEINANRNEMIDLYEKVSRLNVSSANEKYIINTLMKMMIEDIDAIKSPYKQVDLLIMKTVPANSNVQSFVKMLMLFIFMTENE